MRHRMLLLFCALVAVLPLGHALADDKVELSQSSALVGQRLEMHLQVTAPKGATVELAPGTAGWTGVELVSLDSVTHVPQGNGEVWLFDAVIAPFLPTPLAFAPTVSIVQGSEATIRALPPVSLTVLPTLKPDDPPQLSAMPAPSSINGAESRWLKPAIGGAALVLTTLVGLALFIGWRRARRWFGRVPDGAAVPAQPQTLTGAESLLDTDPVGAYRLMSSVVKSELARRHGLRATALTTTELRQRLDAADRWQARLVGGLLEECDSVIYAGYRPAAERRRADLTMAREIIEVD
jgi:hypothetical protein